MISLRIAAIGSESFPLRQSMAAASPSRVFAAMMSRTASAWVRSRRSFRKARFVNSPPGRTRPGPQNLFEDGPEDERTAVTVDLQRVFAGVGAGFLQKGDEDLVEDGACRRINDVAVVEVVGEKISGGRGGKKAPGDPLRRRSADADQTDPPDPGRGGDGCNGVPEGHRIRAFPLGCRH